MDTVKRSFLFQQLLVKVIFYTYQSCSDYMNSCHKVLAAVVFAALGDLCTGSQLVYYSPYISPMSICVIYMYIYMALVTNWHQLLVGTKKLTYCRTSPSYSHVV